MAPVACASASTIPRSCASIRRRSRIQRPSAGRPRYPSARTGRRPGGRVVATAGRGGAFVKCIRLGQPLHTRRAIGLTLLRLAARRADAGDGLRVGAHHRSSGRRRLVPPALRRAALSAPPGSRSGRRRSCARTSPAPPSRGPSFRGGRGVVTMTPPSSSPEERRPDAPPSSSCDAKDDDSQPPQPRLTGAPARPRAPRPAPAAVRERLRTLIS